MARRRRSNQLTVVCWLYPGSRNYRPTYANVLYKRVQKYLSLRHRFVCIYDDTAYPSDAFDPGIELMPIPEAARAYMAYQSLGGPIHPSCYQRLWHFSDEAADVFPGRVFMFDLDSIPIGEMKHLVEYRRDADFITLLRQPKSELSRGYVCGGSWILRSGSLTEIWGRFVADPDGVRRAAADWFLNGRDQKIVGWVGGSDQSVMSYMLVGQMSEKGPITTWPEDCGIRLWDHFRRQKGAVDGCLLHFNGVKKPWQLDWPITRKLYGDVEYRVISRPLKYGAKRYEVGAPFMAARPSHARALLASGRIEAV